MSGQALCLGAPDGDEVCLRMSSRQEAACKYEGRHSSGGVLRSCAFPQPAASARARHTSCATCAHLLPRRLLAGPHLRRRNSNHSGRRRKCGPGVIEVTGMLRSPAILAALLGTSCFIWIRQPRHNPLAVASPTASSDRSRGSGHDDSPHERGEIGMGHRRYETVGYSSARPRFVDAGRPQSGAESRSGWKTAQPIWKSGFPSRQLG
jgi:hypothetical protein